MRVKAHKLVLLSQIARRETTPLKSSMWRIGCLWLSHLLWMTAASGVGMELARWSLVRRGDWLQVIGLVFLPAIVLSPLLGPLVEHAPRRIWQGALLLALLVMVGASNHLLIPLLLVGLCSVIWTIYVVAFNALLPAIARAQEMSLTRLHGLCHIATGAGCWIGVTAASQLHSDHWFIFVNSEIILALILSLPAGFSSQAGGPRTSGFIDDIPRLIKRRAVPALLGCLALWHGVLAVALSKIQVEWAAELGAGIAGGALLALIQPHAFRSLGFHPFAALGMAICLAVGTSELLDAPILWIFIGASYVLLILPLDVAYQQAVPIDRMGSAMALRLGLVRLSALIWGALFYLLNQILGSERALWILAGVAAIAALVSFRWLLRAVCELCGEILIAPLYRITGHGPGLATFPRDGPVIVIANHTSWFDPMWLGKVTPRPMIAMMTSMFFDLPGMRWLMTNVFHSIRVEAAHFRRDVPEIRQAIAALDRGEMLVVFPEGGMRRREETPLKQFGQGIWHILQERPTTPVVVCWIEGGWGSYCSYKNGPPTKNKRLDFMRPIKVAVESPQVLPLDVLTDHRTTRTYLMQACLQARKILGLEVLSGEKVDETEPG